MTLCILYLLVKHGLLNAINEIFRNCHQRFCLRHIHANFQKAGFRGEELKKYMYAAAYSYPKPGFDVNMENLRLECKEAWDWLSNIEVKTWARWAMDTNCKTDLVLNNLSEVFNKMILDVRGKPIKTMCEGIRTKLMVKYNGKRVGGQNARWEITPTYSEKLEECKRWARNCKAQMAGPNLYQIESGENTYLVHLAQRTCGCRRWDMTGIPCHHVVTAIYKSKQHPEDFVCQFFKKEFYMQAFTPIIYPVPGPDLWRKTATRDIDPPVYK